ncbi:hypothetical protein [Streptomyces xinghaiensis]|uniref:hypothetical protein n=1 Tax=Streptomyces xinghaiensis TaxID=1038928 RepID=UPI0002F15AF1|nr:hypothetical protein [Streptomyces xinghaiensis]MZE80343.1 hypothetical protein [Streptomyces sp. SID5475]
MAGGTAYDTWQELLEADFFGPQHAGHAVVFYVDDAAEGALMHRHGLLCELADAVGGELDWGRPSDLFCRIKMRCQRWEAGKQWQAPPSLPVLAASVLAASKMAADPDVSSANYYTRLAEVFRVGSPGRKQFVDSFPAVAAMWEQLHAWLEQFGGSRGQSTISSHPHWSRIGYPLSQALLRESDRRVLTRFFAASGVKPGSPDEFPGQEVIRLLRLWTARSDHGLSAPFHRELHHPRAGIGEDESGKASVLEVLLERLVEHWDGTLYEPKHRKAAPLKLILADRGRKLEWAATAVEGLSETVVSSTRGESFRLFDPYGGLFAGLESLMVGPYQLSHGLDLEGEELVLHWQGREVVFFTEDEYSGDYVSTSVFNPGEPHWILVADGMAPSVRETLTGLLGRKPREARGLVPGWTLFKNIDLADDVPIGSILQRKPVSAHFVPAVRRGTRFAHGLKIATRYGQHHYLAGGEPDLLLPRNLSSSEGRIVLCLDGRTQAFAASAGLKPYPLREWKLEPGLHRIGADGHELSLTVSPGIREHQHPEAGRYGHRCEPVAVPEAETLALGTPAVRGASAPASLQLPRTVLLPRHALEVTLLGPAGQIRTVELPAVPEWAAGRLPEGVVGYLCEINVPDGYVWALLRKQRSFSVRLLDVDAPIPAPLPGEYDYEWAESILSGAEATPEDARIAEAWQAYIEAAKDLLA